MSDLYYSELIRRLSSVQSGEQTRRTNDGLMGAEVNRMRQFRCVLSLATLLVVATAT